MKQFWRKYHNHIYGVVGVIGLLVSIFYTKSVNTKDETININNYIDSTVMPNSQGNQININYQNEDEQIDYLSAVDLREEIVIGVGRNGNEWKKPLQTKILKYLIYDLDGDGNNEVLIGGSSSGNNNSKFFVLDQQGNFLWEYRQTSNNMPYYGPDTGSYDVSDIEVIDIGKKKFIVVSFKIRTWYQSVIKVFDVNGKTIGTLWHPGHINNIEIINNSIIAQGYNNDLRQTNLSKRSNRNFSVVFSIDPKNVYGESLPYFGTSKPNESFNWYYILSDQNKYFKGLNKVPEGVVAWTDCGKAFYFNQNGSLPKVGIADNNTCNEELKITKIK